MMAGRTRTVALLETVDAGAPGDEYGVELRAHLRGIAPHVPGWVPSGREAIPALLREIAADYWWTRLDAVRALGALGPAARGTALHLRLLLENPRENLEMIVAVQRALKRIEAD